MKYIAPDYMNNTLESSDVITFSRDVVATTEHKNGVVENTVNLYKENDDKTKEFVGQMSSFEFSIGNFFKGNN
jgi:hypothetical protein